MKPRRDRMRILLLVGDVIAIGFVLLALQRNASVAAFLTPAGRAQLEVPAGFEVNVFAEGLAYPRFLEFGPDGRLYVAEAHGNRIVALADRDGDGVSDDTAEFAAGLATPHSVTWHQGALYVGVPTGVIELKDTDTDGRADARRVVIDNYPTEGHSTRTVLFLRDGRMLVSVGSSCNVCVEDDKRRATIVAYDGPKAGGERIFASGLRNAVGLALHPVTGDVWATNNGRDWLGDDLPPETINIAKEGTDFGWPRCHAGDLVDPEFGGDLGCRDVTPPAVKLQAHSAPLGLVFYTASAFPASHRGDLFVAYHGSWNRSVPTGYKVVRVPIADDGSPGKPEDFATGFLDSAGKMHGRPVGLAVGPDGFLYISDDKAGLIYRVTYAAP